MLPYDLFTQHSVRFGEATVLLDFETDSYLCRYDGEPADRVKPAEQPCDPRWQDPPHVDARVQTRDIGRYISAYGVALLNFRRQPVRTLLIEAYRLELSGRCQAPEPHIVAARFERLSLYLPFRPSCLLRAYALSRYLALHGHAADWVIGVQLFPFRAHCWLATGDMLLGERAHLIEDYVPIYRLRRAPA